VIPAAGKSTRTYPLTESKGKPLLKICNKTVIERNLDEIKDFVDEVIMIIGYHGNKIIDFLGDNYQGLPIKYVWQKKATGWADAISRCKDIIKDRFIIMGGDDLYSGKDIRKCLDKDLCALVKEVDDPSRFGVIIPEENKIKGFVEKPKEYVSNLASILLFTMDKRYFEIEPSLHESGEYHPANIFEYLSNKYDFYFEKVEDFWIPIGYPWDILHANEFFLKRKKDTLKNKLRRFAKRSSSLEGKIEWGRNTIILPGTYITGPVIIGENCVIGPNARIRGPTSIGDNCIIGQGADIKESVIGDYTKINHYSIISDSVIGSYVNVGANTITANLRHDNNNIKFRVKGKLVNTGRRKLGAMIGDGAKLGVGTIILPGRVVHAGQHTYPGQLVK